MEETTSWEPLRTEDGSWTLVHREHGQACHSEAGAWTEARERYAAACGLRRLAERGETVRLLDVGTGLGLNLAAALEALDGTNARLEAVTLESDPSVIESALALAPGHPEAWPWVSRTRELLSLAAARPDQPIHHERGELTLLLGNGRERLGELSEGPRFDAVFLDPFSPGVESELWQPDFLARIAARMAPDAVLSTYTTSLRVRVGLASAGLNLAQGPRVGSKAAGTLASHGPIEPPLDARTLRRVRKRVTDAREPSSSRS